MINSKFISSINPRSLFNLLFILVLLLLLAYFEKWKFVVPGAIIYMVNVINYIRLRLKRKKEIYNYIENLTSHMDLASKDTLLNFPMPLLIVEKDGTIVWFNSYFKQMFSNDEILEKMVKKIMLKFKKSNQKEIKGKIEDNILINNEYYNIIGNFLKKSNNENEFLISMYFIRNTDYINLKRKYNDEKIVVCVILVDNYDELMQGIEDSKRPHILAEINKVINNWMGFTKGILKKFERDKYLFIFEKTKLKTFKDKKFDILDNIKEIDTGTRVKVTLSMGIGINGETFIENLKYANAAIDIALGRGGDQVVVKNNEAITFYGGKTREFEKKTRVKARVVAYALRELIDQASNILIMGHGNCDIDSLGSALGIFRIAKNRDKKANIVLSGSNPTIETLLKKLEDDIEYDNIFVNKTEVLDKINEQTLLIIVDTHRPDFTEAPEVLQSVKHVVVIDHHRRGKDFVKDTVLTYQETYASSTCELVTEILEYVEDKLKLKQIEAEALYAGIVVDTKNFTVKAGVRTFEAAANLRRQGVDTFAVKQLFQNDINTYLSISDIIKNAELFENSIAISVCRKNEKNAQLVSAQAADQLIVLSDINAAFVLGQLPNEVFISGRSSGDLNVQFVLEKLGGGGHLTAAGAQIAGISVNEAKRLLINAIKDYLENRSSNN
ncbi:MAG: DHH family phosphoesterase [Clostridiales bacterium]